MTSCLLVKAPDRLVAVADGRLSIDETTVSFDTTMKVVRFVPRYRIPRISMGRFSHFIEFTGRDWFVAYAGTYALVGEVLNLFRQLISERIFLTWERGVATLSYEFDQRDQFDESYNFTAADYLEITEDVIVREFRSATQVKCDEWSRNRRQFPECEFLLFGKKDQLRFAAFKVSCDPNGWSPGAPVRLVVDEVRDGNLTTIGSPEVAGEVHADNELLTGLEGWRREQDAYGFLSSKEALPLERDWSVERVEARFREHLHNAQDAGVGGSLTVASAGWSGGIILETKP
jgi:hypothetical protein